MGRLRASMPAFSKRWLQLNLQEQKNQAAEHMYQSAVTVQSVNTLNASVKTEIGTMEGLSTGFGDAPHWGGN